MTIKVQLDDTMIEAIAHCVAMRKAYDWGTNPDLKDDLNELYAAAFADGMKYLVTGMVKE